MSNTPKPTNMKTVVVEINGQQDQMIERLVASDPLKRSAEVIRTGFLEFAKIKRLAKD
jgi:Arc/MetJ-type ribon-helix-helix transcriptional regulator